MKYYVKWTNSFKKDYKRMLKRGADIELLDHVIRMLAAGETLPPEYHNHTLTGNFADMQECHIKPDWLLIYFYEQDVLILTLSRTGSHSDLFGK